MFSHLDLFMRAPALTYDFCSSALAEVRWCLPLVIHALFLRRADFPNLSNFGIAHYWSNGTTSVLTTIIHDLRLTSISFDSSVGTAKMLEFQCRAVLARLRNRPGSLSTYISLEFTDDLDDGHPALEIIEDVFLDLIRLGRAGLVRLGMGDPCLFKSPEPLDQLSAVLLDNQWLTAVDMPDDFHGLDALKKRLPDAVRSHIDRNATRATAMRAAVLSLLVPTRVLLFARPAQLGPRTRRNIPVPTRGTLSWLPGEIIGLILRQLADATAQDTIDKKGDGAGVQDGRLGGRQYRRVIAFAADRETLDRDMRGDWQARLVREMDCERWDGGADNDDP